MVKKTNNSVHYNEKLVRCYETCQDKFILSRQACGQSHDLHGYPQCMMEADDNYNSCNNECKLL